MSLRVRVVSPVSVAFDGEAASLVAPAWDGKVGILSQHAPMIALLGSGEFALDIPGGGSRTMYVSGGVLQVLDDAVTVLSEYAADEPPPSAVERSGTVGEGRESSA